MQAVSLVIITKDEEAHIERCIRSVPFAQEAVVLDSGSRDRTVEIARRLGARVFVEPWRGFYQQKVRATALARFDWVIFLDADEALSPESAEELKGLLENPEADAYALPRLSFHLGRWIRHGGWFPDYQVKVFNRKQARWIEQHVHEKIEAEKIVKTKNPIFHWVFDDLADQVNTNNRYSSLGAKDLLDKGQGFSFFRLVFKPMGKFFETFILKRGFLDGLPGFIIAVGAAYSMFLKYAKLWELRRRPPVSK